MESVSGFIDLTIPAEATITDSVSTDASESEQVLLGDDDGDEQDDGDDDESGVGHDAVDVRGEGLVTGGGLQASAEQEDSSAAPDSSSELQRSGRVISSATGVGEAAVSTGAHTAVVPVVLCNININMIINIIVQQYPDRSLVLCSV